MSRQQLNFPPPQHQVRFLPNSQLSQQMYSDYGMPMGHFQNKKSNDSDLVIFNGQVQERQVYPGGQRPQSNAKVIKSSSQKNLPIIYNAYNDRSQEQRVSNQIPKQPIYRQNSSSYNRSPPDQNFEENNSEVYQYGQMSHQNEGNYAETNQFHTFQQLPSEYNPQTAHFLQIPSDHVENHMTFNENKQEIKGLQAPFEKISAAYQAKKYLTLPEERPFVVQQPPQIQPKSQSRIIIQGTKPSSLPLNSPPHSPKIRYQYAPQQVARDNSPNLIQIPQQQYQSMMDQLSASRLNQQHLMSLKMKSDELSQKQHFYWQQNMTLRQQNKRLRDLVSHFQKREKELIKEKEDFKEESNSIINKYRESLLEEFSLLFERYRLELQRSK